MVRLACIGGAILWLLAGSAAAGQASATFAVGIMIGGPAPAPVRVAKRYTWGAAAISVRAAGFANLRRLQRSETLYWFQAEREGRNYRVAVSVIGGSIKKTIPA